MRPASGLLDPGAPAVRLALPKFKLETSLELSAALERMGITNAFRPAQFDAISKGAGLHISTVVHKTFVAVDERGIEEAAATGVAVATSARSKAVDMRFNRPFLIALTDEPTGAPLFLGRVTEPSA